MSETPSLIPAGAPDDGTQSIYVTAQPDGVDDRP